MEDIYEYDFTSTGPQGLLQGRFALEMLRTGQAAKNSFIGQLSKLKIELGALSKQFTRLTQQVTSDQLLQLNMLLLSNTKKVGVILTCCGGFFLALTFLLIDL